MSARRPALAQVIIPAVDESPRPLRVPTERIEALIRTGDQLIVWGGIGAGGSIPSHGETYDPVKNVWSALPKAPLRARVDAVAVWSGAQMLIWGGSDARGVTKPIATFSALSDGAALTPASA